MIQTRHLHHFQASRWGRVTEMNKITFPLERCRKNEFSPSHAAWETIIIGIVWKIIIGNGRKLTHDVEAMIQTRHLHHFQASRWGRVTEMNKSTFPLERCRKHEFSPSHFMGSRKKNASHAAWESQTLLLRHLSGGTVDVTNDEIFVVVDFGGFWGRTISILAGSL